MDRLTKGFDRLNMARRGGGDEEDEWKTVGSPKKQTNPDLNSCEPLLVSHSCPYIIYQMPRFFTDESILRLVNNVVETGPETNRLFLEVTLGTYPKHLVILRGVPGSGKSSVATALMATTRKGTICSADDFFKDGKGNYNFNPGRLGEAHASSQTKCRKLMEKEISPVIIDNTHTRRFEMEPYVRLAIENNYAISVFEPETEWKNDSRILAQKNVHRVPRGKIQDMIDRFEQIIPFLLVEDVRKNMGDIGMNYNPVKAMFLEEYPPQSMLSPLLGSTKLEALIPPSMALTLGERKVKENSNHYFGSAPPTTPQNPVMLSEFVLDSLTKPSVVSPKGTSSREWVNDEKKYKDGKNNATAAGNDEGYMQSSRMAAVFPNDEEVSGKMKRRQKQHSGSGQPKNSSSIGTGQQQNIKGGPSKMTANALSSQQQHRYSESVLQSAEVLLAYFPTYSIEALADVLEKYDEDINEAMNALLDSGYSVAEEIIPHHEVFKHEPQEILSPAHPVQVPSSTNSESHADNVGGGTNIFTDNSTTSRNHNVVAGAESLALSSQRITDSPSEDSNSDWFDIKLPHDFITKLAKMYGQENDPNIQIMLQSKDGLSTRLPPGIGFSMYRKLIQNAEAKAFKEAEEAAKD